MAKLRVGIVGAGTAGLATAIALACLGHEVHVFEKHPSLAALGAGVLIQPQGVVALGELGVGSEFVAVSVPIERLVGTCHRGWKLVDNVNLRLKAKLCFLCQGQRYASKACFTPVVGQPSLTINQFQMSVIGLLY